MKISYRYTYLFVLAMIGNIFGLAAQSATTKFDSLIEEKRSKNHKNTPPVIGGTIYLLNGVCTGEEAVAFNGYLCVDSMSMNSQEAKVLADYLIKPPSINLQTLCLFSPNIGVELYSADGQTQQYLVAFDCEQVALVADSPSVYLASPEQIVHLEIFFDELLNNRLLKPQQHEWIPMRKE